MTREPTAAEIEHALRRASALSDLGTGRRLDAKIPMSAAAVASRLRAQSELRAACLAFGAFRETAGSAAAAGSAA